MRVLVVYCHPVETSFHSALHQEVLRQTGKQARVDYHAHYHMNVATPSQLTRFKDRVGQAMARFA